MKKTLHYQRSEKSTEYSSDTLGGELADVMVCLAILADTLNVDFVTAVREKVKELDHRSRCRRADHAKPRPPTLLTRYARGRAAQLLCTRLRDPTRLALKAAVQPPSAA